MGGQRNGLAFLTRFGSNSHGGGGLLPVQRHPDPVARAQDGAREFWAAMILRALDDVRKYRHLAASSLSARRLVESAIGWLTDPIEYRGTDGLTFRQCCDGLGLDGDLILAELRRFLRSDPATYRRPFGATSFVEAVRVYRRQLALTQAELAQRLQCQQRDISDFERGVVPPPAVIDRAHALGMF